MDPLLNIKVIMIENNYMIENKCLSPGNCIHSYGFSPPLYTSEIAIPLGIPSEMLGARMPFFLPHLHICIVTKP